MSCALACPSAKDLRSLNFSLPTLNLPVLFLYLFRIWSIVKAARPNARQKDRGGRTGPTSENWSESKSPWKSTGSAWSGNGRGEMSNLVIDKRVTSNGVCPLPSVHYETLRKCLIWVFADKLVTVGYDMPWYYIYFCWIYCEYQYNLLSIF